MKKKAVKHEPVILDSMGGCPELTMKEANKLMTLRCCDCGGRFYEGPCGGLMMNVMCDTCDARFNITHPEVGYPFMCHRLSMGKPVVPVVAPPTPKKSWWFTKPKSSDFFFTNLRELVQSIRKNFFKPI